MVTEHFAAAARHLGEFNGRFLVGGDQPADWWLSRGWLRGWTERAEPMITQLPSLAEHPVVAELFAPSTIGLLLQVWEQGRDLCEALDALPQSTCHQDLFPRNAFIRVAGGAEQTVAIDWAFCGSAALGADLAPLLGASLGFLEADCYEATNWSGFAWTPTSTVCDSPAGRATVTTFSLATSPQSP
jgi:Ser/Thr protein kinase RdoA (MazF antagonist)